MTELDEKIAARRRAKKKKPKKKSSRTEPIDNGSVGSGQLKSPPELQPPTMMVPEEEAPKKSKRRDKKQGGGQLKSPPEAMASHPMVGAHSISNDDVSPAERMKFGSSGGDSSNASRRRKSKIKGPNMLDISENNAKNMPGAYIATSADMSNSERLKFGAATASSGAATKPGA
eukprot:CAMPEP_0201670584 /NCGR_PEP_ID=MMETSP0494-20130426/27208_1 /ASSEMBLY_ACC=CAM_ASM_000839 /TAXON_ID=420259 /ORGANISM="Thalassiosira gravida, Strain GMp14c1" /LENGTH=172 /DNA_ID=CAMNT_0048151679 /DNA_START=166 /DNA_END=681 /DNA_ORIENTATION=+